MCVFSKTMMTTSYFPDINNNGEESASPENSNIVDYYAQQDINAEERDGALAQPNASSKSETPAGLHV